MRASLVKAAPKLTPIGGLSPAVAAMSEIVSALSPRSQLARESRSFTDGEFAPLNPIAPSPIDRPGPDGRPEPRRYQYPVGYNLPTPPGAGKLIDFQTLRNMADLHGVTRKCIEIRKREVADSDWEITVRSRSKKDAIKTRNDDAVQKDIERITKFFERPDPIQGRSFGAWIKTALEEVFVIDALSIYLHPTWDESQLSALEVVDGSTIKPLIDLRGARPMPPNPAYQQFIYGFPRSEFLRMDEQAEQALDPAALATRGIKTQFSVDELLYKPMVERTWTPYGFPPVEQIILAINLALKREQWHLAYFTDSNVPAGLIQAPETWTPGQIQAYQDAFDALLQGDIGWKRKIKVVPAGDKFQEIKPPVHEMDFDHFLIRMVCLGFDVMPDEIGFPPESGLGGKGYSEGQAAIAKRKSLVPMQRWLKTEILDPIIATQFGRPDLQFRWLDLDHDDAAEQEEIDHGKLSTGRLTINGWRIDNDQDPFEDIPEADEPMIITATGPVFLRGFLDRQKQQDDLASKQAETQMTVAQKPPLDPNKALAVKAQQAKAQQQAKKPAPRPSAAKLADLARWKRKATKALKDGRSAAVRFESEHIAPLEAGAIREALAKAASPDDVARAFKAAETEGATVVVFRHPKTELNGGAGGGEERFRGWLDPEVTPEGRADGAAMADSAASAFRFARVASSDFRRAHALADPLAEKAGLGQAERDANLRPWNLGDLSGQPINEQNIEFMRDHILNPTLAMPNGEPFAAFRDRFLTALQGYLAAAPTDGSALGLVTHTRNIRVLMDWLSSGAQGTDLEPDALFDPDDPVLPGGYIVLRQQGGIWVIDRSESEEEDGASAAKVAAVDRHEPNRHPAWLTAEGLKLEDAFRTLETTFFDRGVAELANDASA